MAKLFTIDDIKKIQLMTFFRFIKLLSFPIGK